MATIDTDSSSTADQVPDSIIERIQKMLALAERNSNPAEAANALAMAQGLLQKYNLNISAINDHKVDGDLGSVQDKAFEFESKSKSKYGPNRTRTDQEWVSSIARAVARGSFCRVIINRYQILFIGRARNVDASMYMFANICSQIGRMALEAVRAFNAEQKARRERLGLGDVPLYVGNNGSANYTIYRNSWLLGAAETITHRLEQQRRDFEQMRQSTTAADGTASERTGREVVLAADYEIGDYMQEKFGYGSTRPRAASTGREVYVDSRTPEQKAADLEYERKWRAHQAKLDEAYFRRYGRPRWQKGSSGGPRVNSSAYQHGVEAGRRVSLDAGHVTGRDPKRLK